MRPASADGINGHGRSGLLRHFSRVILLPAVNNDARLMPAAIMARPIAFELLLADRLLSEGRIYMASPRHRLMARSSMPGQIFLFIASDATLGLSARCVLLCLYLCDDDYSRALAQVRRDSNFSSKVSRHYRYHLFQSGLLFPTRPTARASYLSATSMLFFTSIMRPFHTFSIS